MTYFKCKTTFKHLAGLVSFFKKIIIYSEPVRFLFFYICFHLS